MSALTRQGVRALDPSHNARRNCSHRWEQATRREVVIEDGEAREYRVHGKRCVRCQEWSCEDRGSTR